jgi:hypothetical protein
MVLPAHSGPRPLIQFRNYFLQTQGIPRTDDQLVAMPLPKHRTTQTHTHTKHQCLKWDSIPAFKRTKTVHYLDRAVTVIGECFQYTAQLDKR